MSKKINWNSENVNVLSPEALQEVKAGSRINNPLGGPGPDTSGVQPCTLPDPDNMNAIEYAQALIEYQNCLEARQDQHNGHAVGNLC